MHPFLSCVPEVHTPSCEWLSRSVWDLTKSLGMRLRLTTRSFLEPEAIRASIAIASSEEQFSKQLDRAIASVGGTIGRYPSLGRCR